MWLGRPKWWCGSSSVRRSAEGRWVLARQLACRRVVAVHAWCICAGRLHSGRVVSRIGGSGEWIQRQDNVSASIRSQLPTTCRQTLGASHSHMPALSYPSLLRPHSRRPSPSTTNPSFPCCNWSAPAWGPPPPHTPQQLQQAPLPHPSRAAQAGSPAALALARRTAACMP
jgi:hypothetical protein